MTRLLILAGLLSVTIGVRRWWRKREERQRERSRRKQYGGLE